MTVNIKVRKQEIRQCLARIEADIALLSARVAVAKETLENVVDEESANAYDESIDFEAGLHHIRLV